MSQIHLDVRLKDGGEDFVIAIQNEKGEENMIAVSSEKLCEIATHFLILADEAARQSGRQPDRAALGAETPVLVPTKGAIMTETENKNVYALRLFVGTQQFAVAIPKNSLSDFRRSIPEG